MRSVRCVYRNVRFYAFYCISSSGGMLFFVCFPCYYKKPEFGRWKNVMKLYGLRNVNVMGLDSG